MLPLMLLLGPPPAEAYSPDRAAAAFLRADVRVLARNQLDGAKSLEEWTARLPRLRREYLDMLGLHPLPERTPLRPVVTGSVRRGPVVIDMVHFQSVPGLYVTANLYRPADASGPLPAIVYVCGHSGRGRDGNKTAFQDHGMWFARHGYLCLVLDTLQLGEIAGRHHGTYNQGRWWWHSAGYTPAGVECWNGVRAIDYLVSRKDVDASKIGVTGISGGGAATLWIAAADPRVKVAVPVSGMSDLESYVSDRVIDGHCDCMFLYNDYRWDWATIAALVAPRPMLFANSDADPIFPMGGNRRIMTTLRKAYTMHGKADLAEEYVSKGGHDYRKDLRLAVFGYLDKHLAGVKRKIADADDEPLPGKRLRVFPEDKDIPAGALNAKIDESFVPSAKGKATVAAIRERAFRTFPEKWAEPKEIGAIGKLRLFTTDGGLACGLKSIGRAKGEGTTLVILEEDGGLPKWAEGRVSGELFGLVPRGVGPLAWTRKSPPNYVERAHRLVGRTVDQGRVYEIATVAKKLGAARVVGRGASGVNAAYAALLEPGIAEVVLVEPTKTHKDGPHYPGILRVADVPEALRLLGARGRVVR